MLKSLNSSICNAGQQNVNITCTNGEVRLVGESAGNEGRVEVCYDRQWGAVCSDYWDDIDAKVVCRQLEYAVIGKRVYMNAANQCI